MQCPFGVTIVNFLKLAAYKARDQLSIIFILDLKDFENPFVVLEDIVLDPSVVRGVV